MDDIVLYEHPIQRKNVLLLILVAVVSTCFLIFSLPAEACSMDSEAVISYSRDIIISSNKHWLASAIMAGVIFLINFKFKTSKILKLKSSKILYVLPTLVVAFHPAWTVDWHWGSSCSSPRLAYSQAVSVLLCFSIISLLYLSISIKKEDKD